MAEQDRLKIVVDGEGTAERETPPADAERPFRRPNKLPLKKALPTDRAKFETQTAALRAFVGASKRGEEPVGTADVAARLRVSENTAGLVNNFFVEAGFLTKAGKGKYLPTEPVNEYARIWAFTREKAAENLAVPLRTSWYFTEIAGELEMGPISEDVAISILSRASGADGDRKAQLELVLQWLEYAKLIRRDNGSVVLAGAPTGDGEEPAEETPETPDPGSDPTDPGGEGTTDPDPGGGPEKPAQVIGFSFEFSLSVDDLAKLTPEQIKATFEAVGKVMAIKAGLTE